LDSDALSPLLADAEYVVHAAGVTKAAKESEFVRGNVDTTRALLRALCHGRPIKKYCHVSSLAAVGPSPGPDPIDESAVARPITPYGSSKLAAEEVCHTMSSELPIVIVRPPAVYGPRDHDVFHLFRWVSFGLYPHTGPAEKELSLIHVRDLARAINQATVHEHSAGETFFAANERPYLQRDVADLVASVMGKRVLHFRVPQWIASVIAALSQLAVHPFGKPAMFSFDKIRDLYEMRWTCSAQRIRTEVGFVPELSLEEGIRDTVGWYRKNGWL
jgi:nucleoside-diphosphate-sugar epimerase